MSGGPNKIPTRLRVALLLEDTTVPAWCAECIRRVLAIEDVEVVAVLLNPVPRRSAALWRRFWRSRRFLLWRAFGLLDRLLFRESPDAFAAESITALLAGIPQVQLRPRQTQHSDVFDRSALGGSEQLQLDVCLNFCHRILRGSILQIAGHGIWSLHHGDGDHYRGGPPGFWEIMERNPVTGSMLQVLSDRLDGGKVLARSWSATDPTSLTRTTNRLFWKSCLMMPRVLSRLAGNRPCPELPPSSTGFIYSRKLYKPPGNGEAVRVMLPHAARAVARRAINCARREQWQLLYGTGPVLPSEMRLMQRLTPPADRLWADPMVIESQGRVYVFIEEFPCSAGHAHISVMEFDRVSQRFSEPVPVLQRPYHLSYPHVFCVDGQYYMIPETSASRQIELYVADEFPHRWRLAQVLMQNCDAVDATVCFRHGQWWMFVGMAEVRGASAWDETFLFRSDCLMTDRWIPHPSNPIVSDVRRARPAGPIIQLGDQLVRPSQDCSVQYGYGLRLNRIEEMTPESYREQEIGYITPCWQRGLYGVHHISHAGGLTMMDVNVRRPRWPSLAGVLRRGSR